jgi:chromosome segregation ATPase
VVERATDRLENVKRELVQMASQRKYLTDQIKRFEELRDHAENGQQRKQFEDILTGTKENLEASGPEEQELQAKRIELESDLRTEQTKWDRLQDELDRLENSLGNSALQVSDRR